MRNALGISTGAAGVCSALVCSDDSGIRSVEYRIIPADLGTHTDPGDLALSAIDLMTTQVPDREIEPDAIVVAYRTDAQAAAVRAAAESQRRPIRLVPETVATLAYIRSTGAVDRYGRVAVADLGASGLTVTVADPADGKIDVQDRTSTVSTDAAADEDPESIAARVAEFVAEVAGRAAAAPEAIVLVGGGGNLPGVSAALEASFDGAVVVVDEPEAATAKGAALLSGSAARQQFPVVTGSGSRVSAALIGALAVGALMLGYGVKELIPRSEENFAPTGSLSETAEDPVDTVHPEVPAIQPDPTENSSADPTVSWPEPSWPEPTWPGPTTGAPVPTYSSPAPVTTTPPPTTTTESAPSTTEGGTPPTEVPRNPLPWIPPKWPEMPSWLPDFGPEAQPGLETPPGTPPAPPSTNANGLQPEGGTEGTEHTAVQPSPPDEQTVQGEQTLPEPTSVPGPAPTLSPEPGSPTPEVPDSLPR